MANYETEEEQVEALKEWWKKNGSPIIVGVVLGVAVLFGWQYWSKAQERKQSEVSYQYSQILQQLQQQQYEDVVANATLLIADYTRSSQAALAGLAKVKAHVELEQLDLAVESAIESESIARSDDIEAVAQLRLAQLYLETAEYDTGLDTANKITLANFIPQAELIKGDLYQAKGDKQAAIAAYKKALDGELTAQLRVIATLKYENIAGKYKPAS